MYHVSILSFAEITFAYQSLDFKTELRYTRAHTHIVSMSVCAKVSETQHRIHNRKTYTT